MLLRYAMWIKFLSNNIFTSCDWLTVPIFMIKSICSHKQSRSSHGPVTVREEICLYLNISVHTNGHGHGDVKGRSTKRGYLKEKTNIWPKIHTLMEYITLRLGSINEVEQWYARHKYFFVLLHRRHVSTYTQVIFRPSFTDNSIKCYTCWDPIMLTEVKYIKA